MKEPNPDGTEHASFATSEAIPFLKEARLPQRWDEP
jgi:hypothetical protein